MRVRRVIHRSFSSYDDAKFGGLACPVCSKIASLVRHDVISPDLARTWGLSAPWLNWMDQREGLRCQACRANIRSRQLAEVVVQQMNTRLDTKAISLRQLCGLPAMQNVAIAEINAAGDLHSWLTQLSGLFYSEYGSSDSAVPSEDLNRLTYVSSSFDLVLNSDVLEHVPDINRALAEIFRVLKPGGLYIFTVPAVWPQAWTRTRAAIREGRTVHLQQPSYHGDGQANKPDFLVFHEFGADFSDLCRQAGFELQVIRDPRNPALSTFVAQRPV